MKKLYSFFLISLLAVISFTAKADYTFDVTIYGDPNLVTLNIGSAASTDPAMALQCSPEGTVNTVTVATETSLFFVYVTMNSGTTRWSCYTRDTAGNIVAKVENKTINQYGSYCTANRLAGGSIEIIASNGVAKTPEITVNFAGTLSKMETDIQGVSKTVNIGANKFSLPSGNTIRFKCVGVEEFYKVEYKAPGASSFMKADKRYDSGEGSGGYYYYSFRDLADGTIINIDTDFPQDVYYTATVSCNEPDYLVSYTVGDNTVANPTMPFEIQVKSGEQFTLTGDRNNFIVNSVTINGNPPAGYTYRISEVMKRDLNVVYNVTRIVRDKSFTLSTDPTLTPSITTNTGAIYDYSAGGGVTVEYGDADLPIVVYTESSSSSTSDPRVRWAYINDELVAHSFYNLKLTAENLHDGDNVFIDFQKPYVTLASNSPANTVVTMYGKSVTVDSGNNSIYLKDDQDDNTIVIKAAEGYYIVSLVYNGEDVVDSEYDNNGEFTFTPSNLDVYMVNVQKSYDSVESIVAEDNAKKAVYNLQGIKVSGSNLPAGIYIVGGKKVLVK